jgi:hypothetical protein
MTMEAIKKGNRVWVIRSSSDPLTLFDVERAIVTSSYVFGAHPNRTFRYRVKLIRDRGIICGTHDVHGRDVFKSESDACVELASRLKRRSEGLLKRVGAQPLDCGLVTACRHGIDG